MIVEVVGWTGAVMMLAAYVLLSLGKIASNSVTYQALNIGGAAGFIVNGWANGAMPSAVLNIIWMMIGLYALWGISKAR